jgi:hypothetical protein
LVEVVDGNDDDDDDDAAAAAMCRMAECYAETNWQCVANKGRSSNPNPNHATIKAESERRKARASEQAQYVPLMKASGVDDGLGGAARDARIGAVVWQSLECVWQAVAAIPVVDACRAPSMGRPQRAAKVQTYLETNWLAVETCMRAFYAERPAEEAMSGVGRGQNSLA